MAEILLVTLFVLTIAHLLTLKLCSATLDHRTAPIFISLWVLLGLGVTAPFFGHLLTDGIAKYQDKPYLLALSVIKGGALYFLFVLSQDLMKVSLSSRHYVTPLSIGFMTVVNNLLGEKLNPQQMFSAIGLCTLAALFFFKGHLADLGKNGRLAYIKLVSTSVFLAGIDQFVTKETNWYTLLLVSNTVLLVLSLALHHRNSALLKSALLSKPAILAGVCYAATELVKFYQQVTINPITVVVTVQAMTKPVILVLSALIWKERTVKEQLVWGVLALAITLPLFI